MRPTMRFGWLAVVLTPLFSTSAPASAQDLLIHGGTVVTSEGSFAADILVRDGVIGDGAVVGARCELLRTGCAPPRWPGLRVYGYLHRYPYTP